MSQADPLPLDTVPLDTSRWSYHVDAAFYDRLVGELSAWDREWEPLAADGLAECERLLYQEARLIDESRFEDWLELFTDDCIYWLPITPGGDPRREACLAFDDRRRLADRVYWLRTGLAHCQLPPSRTRRTVTNVEAASGSGPDERRVRSNFVVHEFRVGVQRALAGSYAHLLRRVGGTWRIAVKQVNLIDSDHRHDNLTIVF